MADELDIPALVERTRYLAGERIPAGKREDDTFFTDEQLEGILDSVGYSVNAAVYLCWAMKTAEYVKYVDISESGSERKLRQRYYNASLMLKHWKEVFDKETSDATFGIRVAGRAVKILEDKGATTVLVNELLGEETVTSVRRYPTVRMPSILG